MGGGRGESLSRGIDAVRPRYGARNASTLRPDGLRRPSHGALMQYKYVVLTNTTIGTFMALLDSNIVLISLPTIIRDLPGTTTIEGIWIILGWPSIFWINVPFGVFATIWAYARLKELGARPGREKLDPAGNLLFAGGLSLALLGVTLGAITGWAPLYLVLLLAGVACLFAFVPVERAVPSPMMDLALFRNKVFSAGVLSNLLASTSRGAVGLVLVFYFQGALGLDALTAGLLLIPFSLAFVSVGPLSGYLSDKYGPRLFTPGGLLVSGVSYLWFAVLPYQVPYTTLVLPMILAGIGGGLFIAPNVASIMNSVPVVRRGVAAGMSATLFNVRFVCSLALAFATMASRMPLPVMQAIFAGLPIPQGQVEIGSFMDAFHQIFVAIAGISLFGAIPAAVRRNPVIEHASSDVKA